MMEIRIDHVLAETVTAPYRVLVTRPTGAAVRGRIEAALADSTCEMVLLDFTAVDCLDFSCADEVIAKLVLGLAAGQRVTVALRGLCDEQREAVTHVLEHHGLAVTALHHDAPPELIGATDEDLRAAFAAVWSRGALDAPLLAELSGWDVARAERALETLARHRVVRAAGTTVHPLPSL